MPLVYVSDQTAGDVVAYSATAPEAPVETISGLHSPQGLAVDQIGNLYVVEAGTDVRVFTAGSTTSFKTLTGAPALPSADILNAVAVDARGSVYVATTIGIWVYLNGSTTPAYTLSNAAISHAYHLAVDSAGNVFVTYASQNGPAIGVFPALISLAPGFFIPLGTINANRSNYSVAVDGLGNLIAGDFRDDANLNMFVNVYRPRTQTPAVSFPIGALNNSANYNICLSADNSHVFVEVTQLNINNKIRSVLRRYTYPGGVFETSVPLSGQDNNLGIATYPAALVGTW